MEAAGSTETLLITYQTIWHHIPEVTNVKIPNVESLVYGVFAKAAVLRFATWKKSLCMHTIEMGENIWISSIDHRVSEGQKQGTSVFRHSTVRCMGSIPIDKDSINLQIRFLNTQLM
jgi:hypothetical protein